MLTADTVSFAYAHAERLALASVSARWEPGKLYALVGPNGSGKTTLLRLLSGELAPKSGEVCWQGRSLQQIEPDYMARRRALLSQSPRLDFAFSVYEVVALGRSPFAGSPARSEDHARICEALEEVDLHGWENRPYPELSRGEKQRVQLARVLAQLPSENATQSALLLDEPTNHLDLAHQHQTLQLARKRADEGRMVITVLHDLNLALQYADHVLVLNGGKAVAEGNPAEILNPSLLAEAFGVCSSVLQLPDGRPYLAILGGKPL